jgi:hypothetical protein
MRESVLTACGMFSKFRHKFKKNMLQRGSGIIKKLESDQVPKLEGNGMKRHVLKFRTM